MFLDRTQFVLIAIMAILLFYKVYIYKKLSKYKSHFRAAYSVFVFYQVQQIPRERKDMLFWVRMHNILNSLVISSIIIFIFKIFLALNSSL